MMVILLKLVDPLLQQGLLLIQLVVCLLVVELILQPLGLPRHQQQHYLQLHLASGSASLSLIILYFQRFKYDHLYLISGSASALAY